jgi:hypothetical protein
VAFIKSVVKLFLREYATYQYREPVLALGVPEFYATEGELNQWTKAWLGKSFPMAECRPAITTNADGAKLGWVAADYFFCGLGLQDVTYTDIPGSEHAADFHHDLNLPFPSEQLDRYNLIMDPGTIEHVFDMKTCLTNVVQSLRVGGVVVHQVPVYMFNGGYYSLNPNLLNDFYSLNGFGDLRTYIVMWDRYHPYSRTSRCYHYTEEMMGGRHALADFDQCRYSPMMLFFARKSSAVKSITAPLQFEGHYHPPNRDGVAEAARPPASPGASVRRTIRRLIAALPGPIADELNGRLTRLGTLRRTRKTSFWI